MKRLLIGAVGALSLAAFALPTASGAMASSHADYGLPKCEQNAINCTELNQIISGYTGHDEPSLLFYSNTAGSGNNQTYTMTLPSDPPKVPRQDGSGGTFNFQLHPAFWFGLAMCDDQSAPNPGGSSLGATVPCTADSDSNIFNSSDPTSPQYIGLHPGTAFMEMQFYPPGWVSWPAGNSCSATRWCAALNIDSLSQNMNTGQSLNPTCTRITRHGVRELRVHYEERRLSGSGQPGRQLSGHIHAKPGKRLLHALGRQAPGRHEGHREWFPGPYRRPHHGRIRIDDSERWPTASARSSSRRPAPHAPTSRPTSIPSTRRRARTPAFPGRLTHTTWRSRTRSGISSTATPRTTPTTAALALEPATQPG